LHLSYIVYIVLICIYLIIIIFFFPETRYAVVTATPLGHLTYIICRRLTIEEVSVIFDTGRLGNTTAATAEFQQCPVKVAETEGVIVTAEKEGVSYLENKAVAV